MPGDEGPEVDQVICMQMSIMEHRQTQSLDALFDSRTNYVLVI